MAKLQRRWGESVCAADIHPREKGSFRIRVDFAAFWSSCVFRCKTSLNYLPWDSFSNVFPYRSSLNYVMVLYRFILFFKTCSEEVKWPSFSLVQSPIANIFPPFYLRKKTHRFPDIWDKKSAEEPSSSPPSWIGGDCKKEGKKGDFGEEEGPSISKDLQLVPSAKELLRSFTLYIPRYRYITSKTDGIIIFGICGIMLSVITIRVCVDSRIIETIMKLLRTFSFLLLLSSVESTIFSSDCWTDLKGRRPRGKEEPQKEKEELHKKTRGHKSV